MIMSFIFIIPALQSDYIVTLNTNIKKTSIGTRAAPDLRIKIYQLFGTMSLEKPLFGHGLMAGVKYQGKMPDTNSHRVYLGVRTPHNVHLQILFDLGFVGATLLLMSFIWPIWRWQRNHSLAFPALLALSLVLAGTLFNFVIWRSWILGAAILTFYFLLVSAPKMKLSDFR